MKASGQSFCLLLSQSPFPLKTWLWLEPFSSSFFYLVCPIQSAFDRKLSEISLHSNAERYKIFLAEANWNSSFSSFWGYELALQRYKFCTNFKSSFAAYILNFWRKEMGKVIVAMIFQFEAKYFSLLDRFLRAKVEVNAFFMKDFWQGVGPIKSECNFFTLLWDVSLSLWRDFMKFISCLIFCFRWRWKIFYRLQHFTSFRW